MKIEWNCNESADTKNEKWIYASLSHNLDFYHENNDEKKSFYDLST